MKLKDKQKEKNITMKEKNVIYNCLLIVYIIIRIISIYFLFFSKK
ncbi:hypothetical protein ACWNY2_00885 [Candidatus Karelsulcia muelleri]